MDMAQKRFARYTAIGVCILALLIALGWFALRETPPPMTEQHLALAATPQIERYSSLTLPAEGPAQEPVPVSTDNVTPTNAAVLYRQAFALYAELSAEQRACIGDPKTNIDAAAEAELCRKIRPICELMHQAAALTNCDWELPPHSIEMKLPHLAQARNLTRAANWSANRCHAGDSASAITELADASRLGHSLASQFIIGSLVDAAIQNLLLETVRDHASSWKLPGDAEILADPNYDAKLAANILQEADWISDDADRLATRPAEEAISNLNVFALALGLGDKTAELQKMGAAQGIAYLRQFADAVREYGDALQLSESDYQKWQESIGKTNDFLALAISRTAPIVERIQRATITTAMTRAGLAIIRDGPAALQSYLDPATGKPFAYTETDDGFELESAYQVDNQPLRLLFK